VLHEDGRNADRHRAELRHAVNDLRGDQMEAARPRAELDAGLDPHAPGFWLVEANKPDLMS
jgi:hypothetical protein